MLILLIYIHLSLSSGPMPHHLMFQNHAPLRVWMYGTLKLGHSLDGRDLFTAPARMGRILIGRMQDSSPGLRSSLTHPKAQGSCLSSLVLPWGMDHTKASCPFPNLTLPNLNPLAILSFAVLWEIILQGL
jgi:hypothetical protein